MSSIPDSIWWWGITIGLATHIAVDYVQHKRIVRMQKFLAKKFSDYMNGES